MAARLTPLRDNVPIVNPDGTPTPQFILYDQLRREASVDAAGVAQEALDLAGNAMPKSGGIFTGDIQVPAEAFGPSWDGSNEAPTKNDLFDKFATAVSTFLSLTDVPDSYIGFGLNFPRIKADGSGLEFVPIGQLPTGGTVNQILRKFSGVDYAAAWLDLTAGIVSLTPTGDVSATDVQAAIAELASEKQTKTATETTPAAQIPGLGLGWIGYGGGFQSPRYYRSLDKLVTIEGLMQSGTDGTVFTLLAGYRPAADLMFICWSGGGAYRVDVQSDGDVVLSGSNTVFSSLAGISFYAV
jgi:hypothetical protein